MINNTDIRIIDYDREIAVFKYNDIMYNISIESDEILEQLKTKEFKDADWELDVCSYHIVDYIIKHWDEKELDE